MPVAIAQSELGVERGPGWLFVKLDNIDPDSFEIFQLADRIWELLEQHLTYRVVLEMGGVKVLRSDLLSQLVVLCRKIRRHEGVIRLAELSETNKRVLKACSLLDLLPVCRDRFEAVMGHPAFHAETGVKPR